MKASRRFASALAAWAVALLAAAARAASAPDAVVVTSLDVASITVQYGDGGNAPGTEFQVSASTSLASLGDSRNSGWTTNLSTAVYGLFGDTTYYLGVRAKDGASTSAFALLGASITRVAEPPALPLDVATPFSVQAAWGALNGGGEPAGWEVLASLPSGVQGHAALVYAGRLYLAGGSSGSISTSTVRYAELQSGGGLGGWREAAALPAPRDSLALAAWGGRLYAGGGYDGTAQAAVWHAAVLQDGSLGPWVPARPLPAPRFKFTLSAYGGWLYAAGGDNGAAAQDTVYAAPIGPDGSIGAWTTSALPQARSGHGASVSRGRLFVSGGVAAAIDSAVLSAPLSGASVGAWTSEASLPQARTRHAMAASEGRLYVAGGHDGPQARSSVWSAPVLTDGSLGDWAGHPDIPGARYLHALAVSGERLYALGGSDGAAIRDTVWTSTAGGTEYLAERAADSGFSAGLVSSGWRRGHGHDFAGLIPNTTYHFRVRARSAAGVETALVSLGSTMTWAAPPGGAVATFTAVETSLIGVQWLAGPNPALTQFRAQASTATDFSGAALASSWGSAVSAVFEGLSMNTTYYFRAQGRNALGVEGPAWGLGALCTLSAVPAGSWISTAAASGFTLEWSTAGFPPWTRYEAQASLASDFSAIAASSVTVSSAAAFAGLPSAATYYARVRSLNAAGVPSAFDVTVATRTGADALAPGVSTGTVAVAAGFPYAVLASWVAAGDDGYADDLPAGSSFYIQWSTAPSGEIWWSTAAAQVVLGTGPVRAGSLIEVLLTDLPPETTASLRVWTRDEAENYSPPSEVFGAFSSPFSFSRVDGAASDLGRSPSLAVDRFGNLHLAYATAGGEVKYMKRSGGIWGLPQSPDPATVAGEPVLAVDNDGAPQIAYRDAGLGRLRVARYDGSWSASTVESGDFRPGGLALDPDGKARLSYYAVATADLKLASWTGSAWSIETLDPTTDAGRSSAVALDPLRRPYVLYRDDDSGAMRLYYRYNDAFWMPEVIDVTAVRVASKTSLAIGADSTVWFSYVDANTGWLKVGSSSPVTGTSISFVDPAAVAESGGLALDGLGRPFVAYYDGLERDLKFARWTGTRWSTGTVDGAGDVGSEASIAIDGEGSVFIAYYDATRKDLKVAEWTGGAARAAGGNAASQAQAPSAMAGAALSVSQIQWTWTDNAEGELGYRLYGASSLAGPYSLIAGTDTFGPSPGAGATLSHTEEGLATSATYYRYAVAVTGGGFAATKLAWAFPFDTVDVSSPQATVNLTGDDSWRRSNATAYDVDFNDVGGSRLSKFQVKASTVPGGEGPDLVGFTDAVTAIGAVAYTTDWALPGAVFDPLLERVTNYISLRVIDGNGNAATFVDAFYVLKDTTPPSVADNQAGDSSVLQSSGTLYDVDAFDLASGLASFEYSVSATPLTADAGAVSWRSVAAVANSTAHVSNWEVDFGALPGDVTGYVSVRAQDRAGNVTTLADAFYVRKDAAGPAVGVTVPAAGHRSALATVEGTASDSAGVAGTEVALQEVAGGRYWDGDGFDGDAPAFSPATGGGAWQLAVGVPWVHGLSYRVIARSTDTFGHVSVSYATAAFTFDSAAPVAAVTAPASGATLATLDEIAGTAEDNAGGAGVASVSLRLRRLSDGLWWNWFGELWSSIEVSTVASGGAAWRFGPGEGLRSNLAHGASYFIAAGASDSSVPSNAGPFGTSGSTFTFQDGAPPAAVTDLVAASTVSMRIQLQWSAPGDDGLAGNILLGAFRIAYSTDPAAAFSSASAQVAIQTASVVPGSLRGYTLSNLAAGGTYYVRLWTADDAGNWSPLSNMTSAQAGPPLTDQIAGRVLKVSSEGITAVQVDCFDAGGNALTTAFSVADGSGSFTLDNVPTGVFRVQATWSVDGITSSVWQDNIPVGTSTLDFVLELGYTLSALTGTFQALAGSQGSSSPNAVGPPSRAAASGFLALAEGDRFAGSKVELFTRGRRAVEVPVSPSGRWRIPNLLPGSYGVRAFNGVGYTELVDVRLGEGELKEVGFVQDPLPEAAVFAFPNPAKDAVTFRFESPLAPLEAQVAIFDVAGQLVYEIPGSELAAAAPGRYHARWDLSNSRGESVASGVYLFIVKVRGGSESQTAKVIKKLAVVR